MKLVIGIVRPEKTNEVLEALYRAEVRGFSMSRVQGHGGELDRVETYRGTTVRVGLTEKVRFEIAVSDDFVEPAIEALCSGGHTGEVGDGKIFVLDLEQVVRIRTGETDNARGHAGGCLMAPGVDAGDTAWMLAATALVLLMTPALGLFYAGLVRSKNTLNTFMMCVAALAVATITWALIGYSFAFAPGNGFIGGFGHAFLATSASRRARGRRSRTCCSSPSRRRSASSPPRWSRARWSSGCASGRSWSSRRCGRCSSTACSRTGRSAAAGCRRRGRWTSPAASRSRWARDSRALAAALVVGARRDYGRQAFLPHNSMFVLLGAGLLWFGWFGFNGGSGFSAGNAGVLAFVNTLLTPACALATWFVLDLLRSRQVTAIGAATAIVVGCVGITPAAGLHLAAVGDGARRRRGAAELRGDHAAAALAGGRDARRARRPRRRRPDRDRVHRAGRAAGLERRRRRRCSTATPGSCSSSWWRCWSRPPTRSRRRSRC